MICEILLSQVIIISFVKMFGALKRQVLKGGIVMKTIKKVALLTLTGAGAGILVAYYQYLAMTPDVAEALLGQLGSIEMLFLISGLQTAALTAIAAAAGFKLRKKLDLPESKIRV